MSDAAPGHRRTAAAVAVLLVVQVLVLYAPQAPGSSASIPHADKVVHAAVFAAPVLVAGLRQWVWWPLVALGCVVHAPMSEVMQHTLLAGRAGEWWDVVADLVGVGLAGFAVRWGLRRPRGRRL